MAIRPVPSLFQVLGQILAPTPEQRKEQIAFQMQFDKVAKCVQNTVVLIGAELWPPKGKALEKAPKPDVPPKQDVIRHPPPVNIGGYKPKQLEKAPKPEVPPKQDVVRLHPPVKLCEQVQVPWGIDLEATGQELYNEAQKYPQKKMKLYQTVALQNCETVQSELAKIYRTKSGTRSEVLATFWEACVAKEGWVEDARLKIPCDPSRERIRIYDASKAVRNKNGKIQGLDKAQLIDRPSESQLACYRECYKNMHLTDEFFRREFRTDLLPLQAYLHIKNGREACWISNIESACFGQVSGPNKEGFFFPDTVAHEFMHGLIYHTCHLAYQDESGALNESLADVFGIMAKQYLYQKEAHQDDWRFGAGRKGNGTYLRTFTDETSAKQFLGTEVVSLPTLMGDYDFLPFKKDNGGVHINSSIPNSAFYRAAKAVQGFTWKKIGQIWFRAMLVTERDDGFGAFALNTMKAAKPFGDEVVNKVGQAWKAVGVMNPETQTYRKVRRLRDS